VGDVVFLSDFVEKGIESLLVRIRIAQMMVRRDNYSRDRSPEMRSSRSDKTVYNLHYIRRSASSQVQNVIGSASWP